MKTPCANGVALLTLVAVCYAPASERVFGQDEQSQAELSTQTAVSFASIVPATSLQRRPVIDKFGQSIGQLENVVIDLKHGYVALLEVDYRGDADRDRRRYLLPPTLLKYRPDAHRLQLAVAREDLQPQSGLSTFPRISDLTASDLADVYDSYSATPYWPESDALGHDASHIALDTVEHLRDRQIRSAGWIQLGRVADFGIVAEADWRVAYAAVKQIRGADDPRQRLAIPLGAFASETRSPAWLLDVDPESLGASASFSASEWPTQIDRRWIEFVSVKYGRSVLDGIQQLSDTTANQ